VNKSFPCSAVLGFPKIGSFYFPNFFESQLSFPLPMAKQRGYFPRNAQMNLEQFSIIAQSKRK